MMLLESAEPIKPTSSAPGRLMVSPEITRPAPSRLPLKVADPVPDPLPTGTKPAPPFHALVPAAAMSLARRYDAASNASELPMPCTP